MKLTTIFLTLILYISSLSAASLPNDIVLKNMIARMLVVGFEGEMVDENSDIVKSMKRYELGGVILFDRYYNDRNKTKNIRSPIQLKLLTSALKSFTYKPMLISVDQEGGRVARLKPAYGFTKTPSAKEMATLGEKEATKHYRSLSKMLKENGINCNFAPVMDLSRNKENKVIYGLERSYGERTKDVITYAKIFANELKKENVHSVFKHFPGHGSSTGDSHEGFVDISKTWTMCEAEPYRHMIKSNSVSMIMTAHVFNSQLDDKYPATLSHKTNTKFLRELLRYDGIIISDDLQMKAISAHYSLKETVTLAINSGVDILLFGNQLANQDLDELIRTIAIQVKNGSIPYSRIVESNKRIKKLHKNAN